ncbi:hypothetical protein TRAPUB_13879 [Trametes pubescens]|uniref:F-box domain-containing protein n=1 Tax=Trametes pubescens TaxID=154538 RepID=A0A1M2VPY6_TRAPU|nr:hypothetical protein TRAPUB_13879 [Trametes pubescens]
MSQKSIPWIPPELLEQILSEVWAIPQSSRERATLFKTLCKVNRMWLGLFLRVAMRDVHIPCPLFARDLLRLLPERAASQGEADLFTAEAMSLVSRLCRSMTFHVDGGSLDPTGEASIKLYSQTDAAPTAISTVLYMVSTFDYLPQLRHVALKYTDWGYDDLFDQLRLAIFPPQATHLTLDYTFSAPALVPLAVYLKTLYTRHPSPHFSIPTVRHLAVSGVPAEFVADMLQICPGLETLEMANPARLYVLAPLPESVRTVVLRVPGVALDREQIHWWMLTAAMEGKLFHPDARGRIVVRSGTPDPVAWTETKRFCRRFGVDLVYERDESEPC